MMSQVSENKYLMRVFEDLLDADGSEIYLKPISDYVIVGEEVNFYTVLESAKRKGQTAIGYRIASQEFESSNAFGVIVNPKKGDNIIFDLDDKLIVLAED